MIAKSEADLNYANSLKDDVLKMCINAPDSNKIKLSEVKDQFKTIPLHILGIVMDVLCGDKALIANIMGRMTLYAVPPDLLNKEKQTSLAKDSCEKGKHPKEKDKENVIPKGMQSSKKVPAAGKKRKELSVHDEEDSATHTHTEHSSAGSALAKNTAAAKKKTKTGAESRAAESSRQHEPKKSNQVVVSNANRSLMTYSPGPLNQDAQKEVAVSQDSVAEEDVEFVSLALYGIFDGMVEVTSLSAFTESLTQKDPSFTKQQVDSCLHHLEMKNKIMIFEDEIYLI